jgi:hypothetical protein
MIVAEDQVVAIRLAPAGTGSDFPALGVHEFAQGVEEDVVEFFDSGFLVLGFCHSCSF